MEKKAFMAPNLKTPGQVIFIDPDVCIKCNICVEICRSDVILPNPEKKKVPVVMYPDECWLCGACVDHCPKKGAIRLEFPLNQRVGWKRKETGEYFRIGMKNPPPSVNRRPIPDYDMKKIIKVKHHY